MKKYRVTISMPDNAPEGVALIAAAGELVKQILWVVDLKEGQRLRFVEFICNDDYDVVANVSRLKRTVR